MSPPSPALSTQQRAGEITYLRQDCEDDEEHIGRSGDGGLRRMGPSGWVCGVREWNGERRTGERVVGNSGSGAVWERRLGLVGESRTGSEVTGNTGQESQGDRSQQGKEDEGSVAEV